MSWPGLRITRKVEDTRPRSIACFVSISRKLAPDRFQSALFLRLQGEAKSMLEMPIADGRRRRSGSRRYRAGSGSRRYAARPPRDRRRLGPAPDRARRSAPSGVRRRSCQRGDRKSVVSGKSVSVRVALGGRRINKKKKKTIIE